jgi:hypothetical protein
MMDESKHMIKVFSIEFKYSRHDRCDEVKKAAAATAFPRCTNIAGILFSI